MASNQLKKAPFAPVDTAWLRMEDPTNLMMITGVIIFDEPLEFQRLKETIQQRLLKYDRFAMRVVPSKVPLRPPQWETDPTFDLNAHVHRVGLPAPGDQETLQELVSDLMSTPLDFSKPLWQFHLVEGYGDGCALLCRLHHCIADGIALIRVMLAMTDDEPEPPEPAAPAGSQRPRRQKGNPVLAPAVKARQVAENMLHESMEALLNPSKTMDMAKFGANATTSLGRLLALSPDPMTNFKGKLGVGKRAAWSQPIPLAAVKAISKVTGGTVNDVLLTAAAGALGRYLRHHGQPIGGLDFRAAVPVNLRPMDEEPTLGNNFGLVFLALPVGVDDPLERLQELKRRMDAIKGSVEAVVAFGILAAVGLATAEIQDLVVQLFGAKATTVMTNVPGPRETRYFAGKAMRQVMFWVPQSGRLGLGVSILSYAGEVLLGVATDAGLVPDPEMIIQSFQEEFEALLALAAPAEAPATKVQATA
ncbi:MAG: wax ester/triacylglycerol synthase family O-acyltransferase [Chloroflexi bacterium]|nr:wax ester/triacylglycerol synthase family O-acyltransferase [Chloroflexota bacterium]MCI0646610.1 wax ester/triacylglycerol synthase family O-acyltransferase [Chloroflexota bacterium]